MDISADQPRRGLNPNRVQLIVFDEINENWLDPNGYLVTDQGQFAQFDDPDGNEVAI